MLPLQSLLDVTLPMPIEGKSPDENFNPFPNQIVYIESFESVIEVSQLSPFSLTNFAKFQTRNLVI